MIHFDDVLKTARDILKGNPAHSLVDQVLVLRDLRGRIRLFLKPKDGQESQLGDVCPRLGDALAQALRPFWGSVLDVDVPAGRFSSILDPVREERQPIDPQSEFQGWWIIERHAAKSAWMSRTHTPPWPANPKTPAIVAFHSHKGGVGRTTGLCAAAINLAREGSRIVVVDLDLEAPALGTLLTDVPVEYGVADYLLERLVAGEGYRPNLTDYLARQVDPLLIGESGEPIKCVPAGAINECYLEKLSRIDYELIAGHTCGPESPLGDLLENIKAELNPACIFLDCRAGLHDLGGLAVQRLSHANVIFGLDSQQSWQGLRCILRCLGALDHAPPCLLVQAMEWPTPDAKRKEARARFLSKSYEVFCDTYYEEGKVPDIGSQADAHYPFHLKYIQAMAGYQTLQDVAELLTQEEYLRFTVRVKELIERTKVDVRDQS